MRDGIEAGVKFERDGEESNGMGQRGLTFFFFFPTRFIIFAPLAQAPPSS